MEITFKDGTVIREVVPCVDFCDWTDCKHIRYGMCTLEEKVIGKEGCMSYERKS